MTAPSTINEITTGMEIAGKVKHIELYGAFIDIGISNDALLHISQFGKAVKNIEDEVKVGQEITVYVLKVDKEKGRIAVSLVKPPAVNWDSLNVGDVLEGEVVRVENFGAFVDIGAERPGMVHVSELTEGFVKSPSDVVSVGQKVQARILKVNKKKRQIDLSLREERQQEIEAFEDDEEAEELPTAMAVALRRAMEQNEKSANKRRNKDKNSGIQDDIISRTLRNHASS